MERYLIYLLKDKTNLGHQKEWIIEYLKILSNNGLHISFESLKELFNSIKDENIGSAIFGLDLKQLKELHAEFIPIYEKITSSGFITSYQGYLYHYSHLDINGSRLNYMANENLKSFKFYVHLLDMIRNNKKNLISNQTTVQQQPIGSNQDNGNLFKKVWSNLIIRNRIVHHLQYYRNYYSKVTFNSVDEMDNFKFKYYLRSVQLNIPCDSTPDFYDNGKYINDYIEYQLPPNIEILQFTGYNGDNVVNFDKLIRPHSIPSSVTSLHFDNDKYTGDVKNIDLNIPIGNKEYGFNSLSIHSRVKKITFNINNGFTSEISDPFPEGIENIKFIPNTSHYPYKIKKDIFPSTLKSLSIFPRNENSPKSSFPELPTTITKLKFHCQLKIPTNSIPSSITNLTISNGYEAFGNGKIKKDVLPSGLKVLNINYHFQIPIGILSNGLVKLVLPQRMFQTFLPGVLPETLEYLSFQEGGYDNLRGFNIRSFNPFKEYKPCLIKGSLPSSLKTLKLSPYVNHMDTLIESVIKQCTNLSKVSIIPTHSMDYRFENNRESEDHISRATEFRNKKYLPNSLKTIICKCAMEYTHFINVPITELRFSPGFTKFPNLPHKVFGNELKSFTFNSQFNNKIRRLMMPDNLEILHYGHDFNQPIKEGRLPQSLTSLSFLNKGYEPLSSYGVSSTVKYESQFNQPLNSTNIPTGLKHLSLGSSFTQPIDIDVVFPNLITLFIGKSNPTPFIFNDSTNSTLKTIIVSHKNIKFLTANSHLSNSILKIVNLSEKKVQKLLKPLIFM